MPEPLLTIEGLSAGYGDVRVLWDIGLAVEAGEITCIVGSNGAGKTTLLRAISGLVPATSGCISFAGEDITTLPADAILARGIAHVPEGRRLFRGLNVRDNLLLGAYLRRDTAEIERDLDYVFTLFPILRERQRQDRERAAGQICGRGLARDARQAVEGSRGQGRADHEGRDRDEEVRARRLCEHA